MSEDGAHWLARYVGHLEAARQELMGAAEDLPRADAVDAVGRTLADAYWAARSLADRLERGLPLNDDEAARDARPPRWSAILELVESSRNAWPLLTDEQRGILQASVGTERPLDRLAVQLAPEGARALGGGDIERTRAILALHGLELLLHDGWVVSGFSVVPLPPRAEPTP